MDSKYMDQKELTIWSDIVAIYADNYYSIGLKSDGSLVMVGSSLKNQEEILNWTDIKINNQ